MTDAAPRNICDVQQTIYATEVDEGTEVGHILDDTFQYLAFLEVVEDQLALRLEVFLDQYLVRNHNVVVGVVDFHHFHFHALADEHVEVTDGLHVDLRSGQERLDAVHVHDQAALSAALHGGIHYFVTLERLLNIAPGGDDLRLFA